MTEFHARYGGYGVMIYWHVERGRVCIYSQLKSCSSSEVAAMNTIFYGKDGVLTGADREHAEVSMLALHLLQSSLVLINTLLIQRVLDDRAWAKRLTPEDRRALNALFWSHVNPDGRFRLDMSKRLDRDATAA